MHAWWAVSSEDRHPVVAPSTLILFATSNAPSAVQIRLDLHEELNAYRKKPPSRWLKMVGVDGFEPPTSCSQSRRSSQAELHPDKKEGVITKFSYALSIGYLPSFPCEFSLRPLLFTAQLLVSRESVDTGAVFQSTIVFQPFLSLNMSPFVQRIPVTDKIKQGHRITTGN